MTKYYFSFGFMEPEEAAQLGLHVGGDPESSTGIWIWAESEEAAIRWGREIAENFMKILYADGSFSWKQLNYVNGIFQKTVQYLSPEQLAITPEVTAGEWPDIPKWINDRKAVIKRVAKRPIKKGLPTGQQS